MIKTQKDIDVFVTLKEMEGASSGEISLELDCEPSEVKRYMRDFEQSGYGEYTIFDGMWHFWFSPFGNTLYMSLFQGDV